MFFDDMKLVLIFVVGAVALLLLWRVGTKNLKPYFSTKEGKGVARGIVLAPLVVVLIALVGWLLLPKSAHAQGIQIPGTWFNDASVFMGIDRTKKLSPMCGAGGYDERSTSNLGAKMNIWQSPSGNVRFNGMYTHHSCAINPDNRSYDAVGVQVEWVFWRR
ncbi:hypothetical protein [Acidovorax phage ACPWH]|nr:hypothetical protein [Acidovorax phage ACPWH]QXV72278.1 hypothetical protein Acf1_00081 [Acidovorax phage ACF1]